jgi:hypothetical protein
MLNKPKDVKDQAAVQITETHESQVPRRRRGSDASVHDAVFGEVTGRGPNYRNVSITH